MASIINFNHQSSIIDAEPITSKTFDSSRFSSFDGTKKTNGERYLTAAEFANLQWENVIKRSHYRMSDDGIPVLTDARSAHPVAIKDQNEREVPIHQAIESSRLSSQVITVTVAQQFDQICTVNKLVDQSSLLTSSSFEQQPSASSTARKRMKAGWNRTKEFAVSSLKTFTSIPTKVNAFFQQRTIEKRSKKEAKRNKKIAEENQSIIDRNNSSLPVADLSDSVDIVLMADIIFFRQLVDEISRETIPCDEDIDEVDEFVVSASSAVREADRCLSHSATDFFYDDSSDSDEKQMNFKFAQFDIH